MRELKQYITPCNTVIIGVNIIVFTIIEILGSSYDNRYIIDRGELAWQLVFEEKEYYRLLTAMFLHGSLSHLFNNMLVLMFVGAALERTVGKVKYILIYIISGIVAGMTSIGYNRFCYNNQIGGAGFPYAESASVGASGAIFGVVGAMIWIVIRNRGQIANISTRQLILFVFFSVYGGITSTGIDNAAHIGGIVFGFISAIILYSREDGTGQHYRGGAT